VGDMVYAEMFLVSYEINHSLGNRILTLQYKDASLILDKVHVGLLFRDGNRDNLVPPILDYQREFVGTAAIKIFCAPCDTDDSSRMATDFLTKRIKGGFVSNVNLKSGGSLLIGTEEILETDCKIPDVSYNFRELLEALRIIGFNMVGFTDRNKAHKRKNHTGSLRNVLNNWGADYGFNFVWDFSLANNTIYAIDLTVPVIKQQLDALKSTILNLGSSDGIVIQDLNESVSIENTSVKDDTSFYLRDAKVLDFSKEYKSKTYFRNLQLSEIIPCKYFGSRSEDELIISSVLSRFNKSARTLYNWRILSECADFSPLGIKLLYKLSTSEVNRYFNLLKAADVKSIEDKYGDTCRVYLATYSTELEEKWIKWETDIAEFLGKYYILDHIPSDFKYCDGYTDLSIKYATNPQTEIYKDAEEEKHALPFKSLLEHPEGTNIRANFPIRIFSRNNVYGTTERDLQAIFFDEDKKDILQEFVPSFEPIDAMTKFHGGLSHLLENFFPGIMKEKAEETAARKITPVLVFAPSAKKLQDVMGIDVLHGSADNNLVLNEYEPVENKEKKDAPCQLSCEVNLYDKYCCPLDEILINQSQQMDDNIGLTSKYSRWFRVVTELGIADFVLPSEQLYVGVFTKSRIYKKTIPPVAEIYGYMGRPGNAAKFEVNSTNISADVGEITHQSSSGPISDTLIVPSDTVSVFSNNINLELLKGAQVHLKQNFKIDNTLPEYTLEFKMAGMNYSPIRQFLTPANGLQSMSISVDENGVNTNFSFSTRTIQLPSDDIRIDKISKSLKLNIFGRTF
jgi:hypothetical protein